MPALVDTVKLFITNPTEAWNRTPPKGNMLDPMLFAILVSWVGWAATAIYGMFFTIPWVRFMPAELRDQLGPGFLAGQGVIGTFFKIVFAPVFIVVVLFIGSGILHLCVMIVGGLSQSQGGFEGTLRVISYSAVADLANIIPFFGGFVSAIWKLVLVVMGLTALHKTSTGKAVAAVLIPLVVCCGCFAAFMGLVVSLLVGALHR